MNREDYNRLKQIQKEMLDLLSEAQSIIRSEKMVYHKARAYWIPQIRTALDASHNYIGGCMHTMEDTIEFFEGDNDSSSEEDYEE